MEKANWKIRRDGEIPNNHLGYIKPCKYWEKLHLSTGARFFHQQQVTSLTLKPVVEMKWMDGQLIFRLLKSKSFTQKKHAGVQYSFKLAWVLKVWYQTPPTSMLSLLNNTSLFAFVPLPLDCLQHKRHEISPQELSAGWQFSKGNPGLFQWNPFWWNILPLWPERCFFLHFLLIPWGNTPSQFDEPMFPLVRQDP